ncbi:MULTISPECIES: hypothetical protein [Anaerorhabdus]|uniref:Phage tail protein n=1 Tax=Anaerorhabdus furcosa TaxID=118967 RepID=A0A1T4M212_9FIRM|nr:hypothetical protein [Anaerorhabdus furcosa]SJZ60798.1 hypothetical protein SAMN02745191_1142 [Anaerorhabdus furcosa]
MKKEFEKIVLGNCDVSINKTSVGITRENVVFTVERTFHEVKHNGSKGKDVGGVIIDEERAKIKFSFLEFDADKLVTLFPALVNNEGVIEPSFVIQDTDFKEIAITGKQKDGTPVKITLLKGFNSSNIEMTFADKDEVATPVEFEACYEGDEIKPYKIEMKKVVVGG